MAKAKLVEVKMNEKLNEPEAPKFDLQVALLVLVVVVCLWGINLAISLLRGGLENLGQLGDSLGVANALFSGLALAGVIYAILLQRAEIKLTRSELAHTKRIFQEQSDSLKLQNAETKKQIFENTFFQLVRLFTDLTNQLKIPSGGSEPSHLGKDVFDQLENQLERSESGLRKQGINTPTANAVYDRVYRQRQNELGHYFRMLYTIIKYVDQSAMENKKFYTNIVRAQLSNSELHLLLYNGLSDQGTAKFKPLIERYALFDNLPAERVRYPHELTKYERSAFGENESILKQLDHNDRR